MYGNTKCRISINFYDIYNGRMLLYDNDFVQSTVLNLPQNMVEVKFYTHCYILIGVIHIHHFFGMAKRIKYELSKSLCNVTGVNIQLENGNLWSC